MDTLFEQHIVRNTALAAEAIWHCTSEFAERSTNGRKLDLRSLFFVLPLVFHRRTAESLATKRSPGALYKALSENREIPIGLQTRVESMADNTFEALELSLAARLIELQTEDDMCVVPCRRTEPVQHSSPETKQILKAARRVGQAFAELGVDTVSRLLEVRF